MVDSIRLPRPARVIRADWNLTAVTVQSCVAAGRLPVSVPLAALAKFPRLLKAISSLFRSRLQFVRQNHALRLCAVHPR